MQPKTHDPIAQPPSSFVVYVAASLEREVSETSKARTSETIKIQRLRKCTAVSPAVSLVGCTN